MSARTNKKSARMHGDEAIEKAKDAREECEAAVSSASSGMMHFMKSICHAAMSQWQQMVTFLAPYITALISFPKKLFSQDSIKTVYNDLQVKFSEYSFPMFISDMVKITLTIMLLPMTIAIVMWKTIWLKISDWHVLWFSDVTLNDLVNWLCSGKDWAVGSMWSLLNGELTFQQFWNDSLNGTESMLRRGMTRFGETSYFTWGIKQFGVIDILQRLHMGPMPMPVKED
jgi:hypothetical protein